MSPKALALFVFGFIVFMFLLFFVVIPRLNDEVGSDVVDQIDYQLLVVPIENQDPDDKDPCVPDPNSEACIKAKTTKEEPCAPNGCKCVDGIWHGRDGKPATTEGRPIGCAMEEMQGADFGESMHLIVEDNSFVDDAIRANKTVKWLNGVWLICGGTEAKRVCDIRSSTKEVKCRVVGGCREGASADPDKGEACLGYIECTQQP